MKNTKNRAAVILITVALLFCSVLPAGCKANEADDIEAIETLSQQFIEAFGAGDADKIDEIVEDGFEYSFVGYYCSEDTAEVLTKIASKTEIKEFDRVKINKEEKTAKVQLRLSFVSVYYFSQSLDSTYMSKEDYLEAVDKFEDRDNMTLTINFVYNEEEGRWELKANSAEKYKAYFDTPYFLNVMELSAEEAEEMVAGFFEGLAEGQLETDICKLDFTDVSLPGVEYADDPLLNDAITEFCKAYFSYFVSNGISFESDPSFPYDIEVKGYVPSQDSIQAYFSSDEYFLESCMAEVRMYFGIMDEYDALVDTGANIYYDLAKQIPDMPSEEYSMSVYLDPGVDPPVLYLYADSMIQMDGLGLYWAAQTSVEQMTEFRKQAAETLYLAGEITENQYDEYIAYVEDNASLQGDSTSTGYYGGDAYPVDWEGTDFYPNQAVNVIEEVPDWCTDGQLVYGTSEPDSKGIYMHYSKEPGWLNTAGYNLTTDELTIMLLYDKFFTEGTILEYDWYIDGETIEPTQAKMIEYSGQDVLTFTIPTSEIPAGSLVEFRLWEEGHTHVIAYVKLTQT